MNHAQLGKRTAHITVHPRPLSLALFQEHGLQGFTEQGIQKAVEELHRMNLSDALGNPTVGL